MKRHKQILSVAAALAAWAPLWSPAAIGAPIEAGDEVAEAAPAPVTWIAVEARNHPSGTRSPAAVVFGIAQERGRSQPASLVVRCLEGRTTVRVDADGLGPAVVAVRQSLDGGRFARDPWDVGADRRGLELSGDGAIAFVTGLYGRSELRLAVARPLSVPLLLTFAVGGAEESLRLLADRCRWSGGPAISDAGP